LSGEDPDEQQQKREEEERRKQKGKGRIVETAKEAGKEAVEKAVKEAFKKAVWSGLRSIFMTFILPILPIVGGVIAVVILMILIWFGLCMWVKQEHPIIAKTGEVTGEVIGLFGGFNPATICKPIWAIGIGGEEGWFPPPTWIPVEGEISCPLADPSAFYIIMDYGVPHPIEGKHKGIDLNIDGDADCGLPVLAAHDGKIKIGKTGKKCNREPYVEVKNERFLTVYRHVRRPEDFFSSGESVKAGQQIAVIGGKPGFGEGGSGDCSSGCHLHFEVHVFMHQAYGVVDPKTRLPTTCFGISK